MSIFTKKQKPAPNTAYPANEYRPVIRQSICTGERTACMQHIASGKLTELMLIRTDADIAVFCKQYGCDPSDIKTVY